MIIYGSIILAIIAVATLKYFFHKELIWWELLIMIGVPALLSIGSKAIIEYSQVTYDEYWGSEVVSVYEQEPYNYWHVETCSRSVPCGTDSKGNTQYCTEYYDCSHQDDVGPEWWCETNMGETYYITEKQYDEWMKQFGGKRVTVKTRTNHDSDDRCVNSRGTKFDGKDVGEYSYVYQVNWNHDYNTSIPVTSEHSYENRVRASDYSVFNYMEVNDSDIVKHKLYDYPKFKRNYFNYPSILGSNDDYAQKLINRVNGNLGPKKEVRIWILLFNTTDDEAGWMQENYWVGGNKNELVINIGVDSASNKINWCYVFSWSNSEGLKDNIKNFVKSQKTLNRNTWQNLASYLQENVDKDWERLNFDQFDYLSVDPPTWTIILTYIITLITIGVFGYFFIFNEHDTDNNLF